MIEYFWLFQIFLSTFGGGMIFLGTIWWMKYCVIYDVIYDADMASKCFSRSLSFIGKFISSHPIFTSNNNK